MKRFKSICAPCLLAALILSALPGKPASAQETISAAQTLRDGFKGIRWGASEIEAKGIHPDLAFVRFALPDAEAVPSRILVRGKGKADLFGFSFDKVQYWFRNDRFWKVVADARDIIGPRTIDSVPDQGFDQLASDLKKRFGAPAEDRFSGGFRIARTMTWLVDGKHVSLIKMTLEGNIESLVLEVSE